MPVVPLFEQSKLDWSHTSPQLSPYSPWANVSLAAGKLARTISSTDDTDKLLLIKKRNDLTEKRIQELLELRDGRVEHEAYGLTEEEKTRINEEYEDFMSDVPSRLTSDAAAIFYSINAQHLGRIAGHELQEMQDWRTTESNRVIVSAERRAEQVPIGNFEALFRVTGELRGVLKSEAFKDPTKAEAASRKVINDTYAIWARTDPDAAEDALVKYTTDLQQIMGGDYNRLLASLQTGRAIAEQRRESDYRWMVRERDELYENTTKTGVTKFLDKRDRLTVDWIVANEKRMNNSQMRILYSLLKAQDARSPMTMNEVDFREYWRLSRLVRHRLDRGHSYETVGQEIADSAEVTIMGTMAKSLMDRLGAERELMPEQKRAYKVIEDMVFHAKDKNIDASLRARALYQLDLWIERHPKTDPIPWMESTILKDQKDDIVDYYLGTFGPQLIPGPEREMLEEFPFATEEEQNIINDFYSRNPNVSNDPYTYKRILDKVREGQSAGYR